MRVHTCHVKPMKVEDSLQESVLSFHIVIIAIEASSSGLVMSTLTSEPSSWTQSLYLKLVKLK